jgi:hypothetical protein
MGALALADVVVVGLRTELRLDAVNRVCWVSKLQEVNVSKISNHACDTYGPVQASPVITPPPRTPKRPHTHTNHEGLAALFGSWPPPWWRGGRAKIAPATHLKGSASEVCAAC